MVRFANPSAFQFLIAVPAIVAAWLIVTQIYRRRLQHNFHQKVLPFLIASVSSRKRRLKWLLQLMCIGLLALSLARPQLGSTKTAVKSIGVEIVFALDVSRSMLAEDAKPSRLEFAKSELNRLLDQLGGDRVGLVAFAGSAYLLSPLTTDKAALKMFLEGLSPDSVSTQGTNFLYALRSAQTAFEHGGVDPGDNARVTRVILVISDGEDHEQGAIDYATKLVNDGTRVFTLGIGTEKGASIPMRDERGYLKGYLKDQSGQIVVTQARSGFLQSLAKAGHGAFYHATAGGRASESIKADLDKLDKAEFDSQVATQFDEKFQVPLALALIIALLELYLGERRNAGRIWRGRFEVDQA